MSGSDTKLNRRALVLGAAAIVGFCGIANAQNAPATQSTMLPPAAEQALATTMPTSAPSVPVDPSTPRGALKSLINAMETGDGDKLRSLIATTNPSEDKMVTAMANMSMAQKKFRDAASAAFGNDAKQLTGDTTAASAEGMSKVDSAKETINGDSATVDSGPESGTPPLTLNKSGSTWKIPIQQLSRGIDAASINQRLGDLSMMTGLINDSATEIGKGTYKTPQEAGKAIQAKMMTYAMQRSAAASQPTTAPSDAPAPTGAGGM